MSSAVHLHPWQDPISRPPIPPTDDVPLTDRRGGELHERRLRRQHPAEEEEEERVVAEGDHGLDDPEDGLVVSEQVFPHRNVFFALTLDLNESKSSRPGFDWPLRSNRRVVIE